MDPALEAVVWERAAGRCEYCRVPQWADELHFHVDHIIARQHGGETHAWNLALACYACNLHKGPNLSGRDPRTRAIVRLFDPRRHKWERHFRWSEAEIVGRTAIGRATVVTLAMNLDDRIQFRTALFAEGLLP